VTELHPALCAQLVEGELAITGRLMQASNATFLTELSTRSGTQACVYKPVQGERPLWDFPHRTLGLREVAAYEVSRIGGFDCVPVTVFVDGPLGPGSLQAWVDSEEQAVEALVDVVPLGDVPAEGWFTCVEGLGPGDLPVAVIHADHPDLRSMAAFDVLINNADRKGGHILASVGHVFGVDHGVSFHTDNKLRTVLWGWAGQPLAERDLAAVGRVREGAADALTELLSELEIEALQRRADRLLQHGRMPKARGEWPSIPWPPF